MYVTYGITTEPLVLETNNSTIVAQKFSTSLPTCIIHVHVPIAESCPVTSYLHVVWVHGQSLVAVVESRGRLVGLDVALSSVARGSTVRYT